MKRISLFFLAALFCFGAIGCQGSGGIKALKFNPQASYESGTDFSLDVADYFKNAEGAEFSADKGAITDGVFTLKLVETVTVNITAAKDGKSAKLTFTLKVTTNTSADIAAKSFSPNASYSVTSDFTLKMSDYFKNADGAVYTSTKGTISDDVLTIALTETGSLPVSVTGTKNGKSAVLSFTLNVEAIWNNAPNVTGTFYEDFATGVDTTRWEVSTQRWGSGVGASPNNVFYSTDAEVVAASGAESGGVLAMRTYGDYQKDSAKRRQGSLLVTRDTFGPGLFEVRIKVVPRVGQCSAMWTYWNGGGTTAETNRYSEIDIEMPMASDYRKWGGTTYKKFVDWTSVVERGTVTTEKEDGVNDGQWHVWAFEWRTDDTNGDNAVVWYLDGKKQFEIRDYTPTYTASFWIGNWFPEDLGWVGVPNFEEAYMYLDWVRITKYDDPVQTGLVRNTTPGGSAVDLGSDPLPVNQYVANPVFNQVDNNTYVAWEKTGTVTAGGTKPVVLSPEAKLTQIISAQYPGYSFDLKVDARITAGTGKLKAYVQYMFGPVSRGKSEEILFESAALSTKTLTFTIPKTVKATDIRIVIETETGTTAEVSKVEMFKRNAA